MGIENVRQMTATRFAYATVAAVALISAGCAIRLGGPKPEGYNAIGLTASAAETAEQTAARIREANGDLVLLSAPQDSAWYAAVAQASGLRLTRPGHTGPVTLGFLTHLESLGDTALVLPVTNGGRIHLKDALYKVDKERTIDLMLADFRDVTSVHEGVRTLLNYIATDVGGTSAVVIGIDAPNAAAGDSASTLVRAAFANALDCGEKPIARPQAGLQINLFYGPEARLSCTNAHVVAGTPNAVVAHVVVER